MMNQWIKVADKLPETGAYLVAFRDQKSPLSKEMVWYVTDGVYYSSGNIWYTGGEPNHLITHYMPYPSPPEEGE